jgi:hypothetical protein
VFAKRRRALTLRRGAASIRHRAMREENSLKELIKELAKELPEERSHDFPHRGRAADFASSRRS